MKKGVIVIAAWTFWQRVNYGAFILLIGFLGRLFFAWTWLWDLSLVLFYGQFILYPTPPEAVAAVDAPIYRRAIRLIAIVLVGLGLVNLFIR